MYQSAKVAERNTGRQGVFLAVQHTPCRKHGNSEEASSVRALILALAPLSTPSLPMTSRVFPRRAIAALTGLTIVAGLTLRL